MANNSWNFLDADGYQQVRQLRKDSRFDEAEHILMKAEPVPAVLDELRKIASSRAAAAKKSGNWAAVVSHLEDYNRYAAQYRVYCLKVVNQAPPDHTERDKKLLKEAKAKLSNH